MSLSTTVKATKDMSLTTSTDDPIRPDRDATLRGGGD